MTAYASDEGPLINRQAGRARSMYRGVAYMNVVWMPEKQRCCISGGYSGGMEVFD